MVAVDCLSHVVGSKRSVAHQFHCGHPELNLMAQMSGPGVGGHMMSTN